MRTKPANRTVKGEFYNNLDIYATTTLGAVGLIVAPFVAILTGLLTSDIGIALISLPAIVIATFACGLWIDIVVAFLWTVEERLRTY